MSDSTINWTHCSLQTLTLGLVNVHHVSYVYDVSLVHVVVALAGSCSWHIGLGSKLKFSEFQPTLCLEQQSCCYHQNIILAHFLPRQCRE